MQRMPLGIIVCRSLCLRPWLCGQLVHGALCVRTSVHARRVPAARWGRLLARCAGALIFHEAVAGAGVVRPRQTQPSLLRVEVVAVHVIAAP